VEQEEVKKKRKGYLAVVEALHEAGHEGLRVDKVGVGGHEGLHVGRLRVALIRRKQLHQSVQVACWPRTNNVGI
jgi:hypothetical protein